ncbi:endonuclease/exonuclease/phosphatase family protein [Streptomyces sp. NPDC051132]|uniref:endonuclease/exonuclease/phosphatase family protein n=1 Tax=unclassified Streptomyces TaxID=2593676 RepID=UPI00341BD065
MSEPTMYGEPVVTVVTVNLERDGGPNTPDGELPPRWKDAHEILKYRRPDVLLRQEATHSGAEDHRRLKAAEELLGMRGYLTPNGVGRNPTALFIRPETFPVHERVPYDGRFWRTPPTLVTARLADVPEAPLLLMSWHAAFNSRQGRAREADEITAFVDRMAKRGGLIGGGDCNEYPIPHGETVPAVDWSKVTDWPHIHHRTTVAPDGSRVSCTHLDRALLASGLTTRHATPPPCTVRPAPWTRPRGTHGPIRAARSGSTASTATAGSLAHCWPSTS